MNLVLWAYFLKPCGPSGDRRCRRSARLRRRGLGGRGFRGLGGGFFRRSREFGRDDRSSANTNDSIKPRLVTDILDIGCDVGHSANIVIRLVDTAEHVPSGNGNDVVEGGRSSAHGLECRLR